MKIDRSVSLLCLTAVVSFIAGILLGAVVILVLRSASGRQQEKVEATSFFYRTMYALFEDMYDPEEGSVSTQVLKVFREYKPRLGNKCRFFIVDATTGYYECEAFFPSGDRFGVVIVRRGGRWILDSFAPTDWERSWRGVRHQYRIGLDS